MTSLLSNVPMNVVGNTLPSSVTSPTATPSTTTTMKPPPSKARLLFNSDGSVKLMGDPSFFPGSGIDGNSHTLVPTIGPDGKMTMLLTPADGQGKTFILSPTNGASLPNPQSILNGSSQSISPVISNSTTSSSSSQSVQTFQSTECLRYSDNPCILPKRNINSANHVGQRTVVTTHDGQTKTFQKSLLTGLSSEVSNSSSQFTTHMRIDPAGSCISTVNVPVPGSHTSNEISPSATNDGLCTSKNMFGSKVLKNIADKVDTRMKYLSSVTGCYAQSEKVITVHPDQIFKSKPSISGEHHHDHKYASATGKTKRAANKPTDHAYTQSPKPNLAPRSDVSKNFLMIPTPAPNTKNPGTYTIVLAPTPSQTASNIRAPSTVTSATPLMTATVGSQSASTPLSAVPVANTSNVINTSSFITAPSFSLSGAPRPPSVVFPTPHSTQPLQLMIKDGRLTQVTDNNIVIPATAPSQKLIVRVPPMAKQNRTATSVSQSKASETCNIVYNAVDGRLVQADQGVSESCTDLNVDAVKVSEESTLDPVTGCLDTEAPSKTDAPNPEPEDDVMSIKIDSVFSLSSKDETENADIEIVVKEEAMDSEVHVTKTSNEMETASSDDEPKTVICHPSYVVLEQMSQKQIENSKECIFKCSEYCRVRTLNFLCSLGLVNCKPTEHTINPIKKVENPTETCSEKPGPKNKSKKRKGYRDKEDSGGAVQLDIVKKEPVAISTPASSAPVSKESTTDGTRQNQSSDTIVSSAKVRKVEPPGSPITKVIKFTKVEKEQVNEKTSIVASPPQKPVQGTTDIGVLPSIYPNIGASLLTKTQVSFSSPPGTVQASKVIPGNPPVQLAANLKSILPMTKLMATNNKQYFLFNLNGQKILVPASNDMHKPKAFVLKGENPILSPNATHALTIPPTSSTVSTVNKTKPPSESATKTLSSSLSGDSLKSTLEQKRSLDSLHNSKKPSKVTKVTHKEDSLPFGIRIKSEPVTHGYGDEEPPKLTKQMKSSCVKIKKERVDSEWQEIWSSASRPLADSSTVPGGDKSTTTSHSVNTSSDDTQTMMVDSNQEEDIPMPDLPMMKVPSTKEIAQKTAAQNDRIERLKAMLKEKEKLIEELKMKRVEEGPVIEEEEPCDRSEKLCEITPCETDATPCETLQMTEDLPEDDSEGDAEKIAPEEEKLAPEEETTETEEETTVPEEETLAPEERDSGDVLT